VRTFWAAFLTSAPQPPARPLCAPHGVQGRGRGARDRRRAGPALRQRCGLRADRGAVAGV